MTAQSRTSVTRLRWWPVGLTAVAMVALVAPLPTGWNGLLQMAAVVLAVVALCVARDRTTRVIAAAVIVVVGAVICVHLTSYVAAAQFEGTFSDDAVLVE